MPCKTVDLPIVEADLCAPDTNFAEIDKIFLGNADSPFTNWALLSEWNARLSNTTVAETAIRFLHVIASKPKPERTKITFSQKRTLYTTPKHTIPFKVDETGAHNYGLLQFLETNAGMPIPIWYQVGKYIYGGNSGILATIIMDDVIDENGEVLQIFEGTIEWEGLHPARILNPMA